MWVVRGAGAEITLFGSVHELPAATVWLSPAIAARFDAADTLVLETIVPTDPAAIGALLRGFGGADKAKPLLVRIGPERAKQLTKAATDFGLPVAALGGSKTWLAALTIAGIAASRDGLSTDNGVEATLTLRAAAAHKPVVGLERPGEQLGYFDALPEADQQALLGTILDELPSEAADTKALVASWLGGRPEEINADKELHASPALERALLINRNARWADWIAGVLRHPGKVFVAVGAAHLTGANSVQAMLAQRGLVVERLQ